MFHKLWWKHIQIHLDHCANHVNFVTTTTTCIDVFHFSYKPDCIFLSKINTYEAFSICMTIEKLFRFQRNGSMPLTPKRTELWYGNQSIISAVSNQSVSQNCDMVINQSHNNCIQQKLCVCDEELLCSHWFSSFLMHLEFVEVFAKKSGM
jgi:hypothetical protein